MLLLVYVDDILVAGKDSSLITKAISDRKRTFTIKILGSISYFLGFEATRDSHDLKVTQKKYLRKLLHKTNISTSNFSPTPMYPSTKLQKGDSEPFEHPFLYRSTIGSLQYLTLSRPDIAYSINKLSQFLQEPTLKQWAACKRILRYLSGIRNQSLLFSAAKSMALTAFADADWASNIDDKRSTMGVGVFLATT